MTYALTPYLGFDQQCEAAFHFYEQVLGATLIELHRYRGSPMAAEMPEDRLDGVMHAALQLPGGGCLYGSDGGGPEGFKPIQGCQLTLSFTDIDAARRIFDALAEGAQVAMPFAPTFWAAGFGMLVDRYGVPWAVNCETPAST